MPPPKVAGNIVNRHYLNKVMAVASHTDVVATSDIYDAHGRKLLAMGAPLTRYQQERLLAYELRRPLESCIAAKSGCSDGELARVAEELLDEGAPLALVAARSGFTRRELITMVSQLNFGPAMRLMLTLMSRSLHHPLQHALQVSLLAMCFSRKLGLSRDEQLAAGTAGILHDIGELYIDPALYDLGRRLTADEWRHIVVHPRIGQLLITENERYPAMVAEAVAQHHERGDGSGYPRGLTRPEISVIGSVLGLAEIVGSLFGRDNPFERSGVALRILPAEHLPSHASLISELFNLSVFRQAQHASTQLDPAPIIALIDDIGRAAGNPPTK